MPASEGPLGRRVPTDFEHITAWPLTATTTPPIPVPVTIGIRWYTNFDQPTKDKRGRWWVGREPNLGALRGGHCVCIPPEDILDATGWRRFYDQGREGACVGFGASRMMSLLNRKRYDARWLWNMAKERDEWADTNPGDDNGTSVRAAMDVLRDDGHKPWTPSAQVKPEEGIAANRWATTVDEILGALQSPSYEKLGAVPFLQSWGLGYPHRTWMSLEVLAARIEWEDGEATVVVDR